MIKDRQIKLIIGSLLHDIGKVVYRSGDGRNHSQSGYEFLKNETDVQDQDILNCVHYHHAKYLKNANIPKNDCAYVTYFADNIAAFSDRRESEEQENGFDKTIPLDSVFNILNGNKGRSHYAMQVLDPQSEINYPTTDEIKMNDYFYRKVIQNITDNLLGIEISEDYLNSLLSVLEANLTYVPSSTSKKELADISLYDHVKMTAAKILKEKLQVIQQYFGQADDHGMAFLYHLTDLLRNTEEQINVARYVYLLSRMEPDTRKSPEQRTAYRAFSKKMYEWGQNEVDRRELITAIYLYVYLHREENAL